MADTDPPARTSGERRWQIGESEADRRRQAVGRIADSSATHLSKTGLSRSDAHALLDAILDLAPLAADPRQMLVVPDPAVVAARSVAAALLSRGLAWMERGPPVADSKERSEDVSEYWRELEDDPILWREAAARMLTRVPTLLPQPLVTALAQALLDLNDGSGAAPTLLEPERTAGNGPNPKLARGLEVDFWCWIYFRKGQGETVDAVRAEVAGAAGVTTKAVDAWRREWVTRGGKEHVSGSLAWWAAAGRNRETFHEGWSLADGARSWRAARYGMRRDR